ncbi:ATP-binding protein [Streptomyces harbinensis]|nr:ATP-binding protein [Streptomyces harbinensis]
MESSQPAPHGDQPGEPAGTGRTTELVAGDFLLTINPVDGSEIASCPPGRRPISPRKAPRGTGGDTARDPLAPPLLEREEERRRLYRLLARGRSVRLTGPTGTGRTALLAALAQDCAELAPDGVIRLTGHRRTPSDLQHELYAAVRHTPGYRPGPTELQAGLREIGAVVLVDDLEFGATALDELLDATPECAFLFTTDPSVTAPSTTSRVEEVFLSGLSRTGALELLEFAAARPLTDAETDWAADLWIASEGRPRRFVQAAALLRARDVTAASGAPTGPLPDDEMLIASLAAALPDADRGILRFAVALGGELPGPEQLPALTSGAATGHDQLAESGLLTTAGGRLRLAEGVGPALAAIGFEEGAGARALAAAQHYTWWLVDPSVDTARAAAEGDVLLAVTQATQRAGHSAAAANLAHSTAPLLAAAGRWSVWERVLRTGQEASRAAGEVDQQAYFHHELGVLAICEGRLDRARAELEASIALRGVLADAGGVTAGRRALALVRDLSGPPALTAGTAPAPLTAATPPLGLPAAAPREDAASEASTQAIPRHADPAATGELTAVLPPLLPHGEPGGDPADGSAGHGGRAGGRSGRRTMVAAGAGVLLIGVLGTVVALGMSSDETPAAPDDERTTRPVVTDRDREVEEDTPEPPAEPGTPSAETDPETEEPPPEPETDPETGEPVDPSTSGTPDNGNATGSPEPPPPTPDDPANGGAADGASPGGNGDGNGGNGPGGNGGQDGGADSSTGETGNGETDAGGDGDDTEPGDSDGDQDGGVDEGGDNGPGNTTAAPPPPTDDPSPSPTATGSA